MLARLRLRIRNISNHKRHYSTIKHAQNQGALSAALVFGSSNFVDVETFRPRLAETANVLSTHFKLVDDHDSVDIADINAENIASTFADVDIVCCAVLTGGTENVVKVLCHANKPVLLIGYNDNNSLAAAIEVREYFRDNLLPSHLLNFSCDAEHMATLMDEWYNAYALNLYRKYLNLRFGLIGTISPWLINERTLSDIEYFKQRTIAITKDEFYSSVQNKQNDDPFITEIKHGLAGNAHSICSTISERDLYSASKIYASMSELMGEHKLDALSIGCFDLIGDIGSTPCIALALINGAMDNGKCVSCEGELNSALCMVLLKRVLRRQAFMANLTDFNRMHNTVLFSHCTAPINVDNDLYDILSHFESGKGVALDVNMEQWKDDELCVIKVKGRDVVVCKATLVQQLHSQCRCRTQIELRMQDCNADAMQRFIESTLGNHHLICAAPHEEVVRMFQVLCFRVSKF